MSVLAFSRSAWHVLGLCIALCGTAAAAPKPPRPALWLLHPKPGASLTTAPGWGHGAALFQGVRVYVNANGTTQRSRDFINGSAIGALRVPDAWGGGFVFHGDVDAQTSLWYARSWLAPLLPLGQFDERSSRITLGFGKVYVTLRDSGETIALDISDGSYKSLGPVPSSPGYSDLRFWDDWFALVNTDVRGVLATFDGGASWHPTGITDESATFSIEDNGIGIRTGGEYLVLEPTGAWQTDDEDDVAPRKSSGLTALAVAASPPSRVTHPSLGNDAVRQAVLHGWPTKADSALLATTGAVAEVNVTSGRITALRRAQYPGYETCHATAIGKDVAVLCPLTHDGVGLYRVEPDLSLKRLAEWQHAVLISRSDDALLAHAPCPGERSASPEQTVSSQKAVCVFSAGGVHGHVLPATTKDTARLIPLSNGGLAVVVPPTPVAEGSLTILRHTSASLPVSGSTPLRFAPRTDAKTRNLVEAGFWLLDPGTLPDDRLGFWVTNSNRLFGVSITKDGMMTIGRRTEADVRRTHVSGSRAVELTSGEIAFQSTDFGQTWREFPLPRGLTAAVTRNTADEVGCSEVGCAFGSWLRVGYGIPSDAREPSQESVSSSDLSLVPVEAPTPSAVYHRPSAYSNWQLTCYPTGSFENAATGSAKTTFAAGQTSPRQGSRAGFGAPTAAQNSQGLDLAPSARRTFLGVRHPDVAPGTLAFDRGDDGEHQFRAYVLGPSDRPWASNSTWLVRVADRFSTAGLWSTAPTRGPWPDLSSAARLFGADRTSHYSSTWQLVLDPSERAGALRISNAGAIELHFIEANAATISMGSQSVGSLAGAVKVNGAWYIGEQDRNRFVVYQASQGVLAPLSSYPVSDFVQATLVRNVRSTRLGVLLRAPAGTWHIYPISDSGASQEPLMLSRDTLNQQWPKCEDDDDGWMIVSHLPLSRFTQDSQPDLLTFDGDDNDALKPRAVVARTVVSASRRCVDALAARIDSELAPKARPRRLPPTSNTIPLTLTDRTNDVRHGYQCGP